MRTARGSVLRSTRWRRQPTCRSTSAAARPSVSSANRVRARPRSRAASRGSSSPPGGRIVIGDTDFASISRAQLHALRRKVQIVFQDPYRSLNPRRTVGAAIVGGPMNYGATRDEALRPRARVAGPGAARPQGARPLSAPVLRRPAAAHLHRAVAGDGAGPADRRRSGIRARRVGAGAGAGAARRDPAAARPRDAVHHARPARGRTGVRPRGRDGGTAASSSTDRSREVFAQPRDDYTKALLAAAPGRGWELRVRDGGRR